MEKNTSQTTEVVVNADLVVGSTYSQFVGVTVTDVDITLEFVFISPREKTKGQVVSRVTLPRPSGEDLARTILNTIKLHEEKKKGKKHE
ncbi:hypothetical protein HY439_01310 [Candidatus Microgenomates bacterium]|nr:hypothetical protein [Candidatus Microgenomates bacterium]